MPDPQWLIWAKKLQAIAQNGLTFANDPFDEERYQAVRAIAAEIMATHTGVDATEIRTLFDGEVGYTTPKVDARGAVFNDEGILLVREVSDGGWTLPGGWVDIYESPSEAIVREIREESGYETRAVKLLALWDRELHGHTPNPHHAYNIAFLCELTGGEVKHSVETDGVGFFARDDIPPLSIERVTSAQIERLFEHWDHPDWPTDFD
jgi:ADP-ribose pyrophosphatase YjhB (NUDIX family)